jgi:hypothetical protein
MRITLLILFVAITSCRPSGSSKRLNEPLDTISTSGINSVADSVDHQTPRPVYDTTYQLPLKINSKYTFALLWSPQQEHYLIYENNEKTGTPLQVIPFTDAHVFDSEGFFEKYPKDCFMIADYNFDGYRDLAILSVKGNSNWAHDVYLFDVRSKRFRLYEPLTIHGLTPDSIKKVLTFYSNFGMGGQSYVSGEYVWQNGALKMINRDYQDVIDTDHEVYERTIEVMKNGRLVLVSRIQTWKSEGETIQCLLEGTWEAFDEFAQVRERLPYVRRLESCFDK